MTTARFQDHFSRGAGDYAKYRPTYPDALFDWIARIAPRRDLALDCATGNGQAAVGLAKRFRRVIATDASGQQLRQAMPAPNIEYRQAFAHSNVLGRGSADVVTVAQALHWLDRPPFYAQVRRVLGPGGVLVVWCYRQMRVDPAVDRVINQFYHEKVGDYWPPERRLVEDGYAGVEFPFQELAPPALAMTMSWTLDEVLGYIGTWSPTRGYRETTGEDPLPALRAALLAVWPDAAASRLVQWPLGIRAGTVEG